MFRKPIVHVLVGAMLLSLLMVPLVSAQTKAEEKEQRRIEKLKARVAERSIGEKATVEVELANKSNVKGYISQAGAEGFEVTNEKTGEKTSIAYRDVKYVGRLGLSRNEKVIIPIIGAVVGLVVVVGILGKGK